MIRSEMRYIWRWPLFTNAIFANVELSSFGERE